PQISGANSSVTPLTGGAANVATATQSVGGNVNIANELVNLAGSGTVVAGDTAQGTNVLGSGALHSLSGNNSLSGLIVLDTQNAGVGVDSGLLTLNANITPTGTDVLGIAKVGAGSLDLSGNISNVMSGMTSVNSGTLLLDKTAALSAISTGTLIIGGDAGGAAKSAVVQFGPNAGSANVGAGTVVVVGSTGLLDLATNSKNDTIGVLDLTVGPTMSGDVETGFGILTLGNTVNAIASSGTTAASPPALLDGTTALSANRIFNINHGNQTPVELQVNANISGAFTLTKSGYGTLDLAGPNSYTGTTTINYDSGTLIVDNNSSLGTAAGVFVNNDSTLAFNNSPNYAASVPITISGQGVTSAGAIQRGGAIDNLGGSNVFAGSVTLAGAATIASSAAGGSLAINGAVTNGGNLLSTAGAGNLALDGNIVGSGGLTDNTTGDLTLGGSNTYTGPTAVNAGTLLVNGTQSSTSATTVASGATLGGNGFALGSTALSSGGVIAPGVPGTPDAILDVGTLNLQPTSIVVINLDNVGAGQGYDQVNVDGVSGVTQSVSLAGATLQLLGGQFLSSNPTIGQVFKLIVNHTGTLIGPFANIVGADGVTSIITSGSLTNPSITLPGIGRVSGTLTYSNTGVTFTVTSVNNATPVTTVPTGLTVKEGSHLTIPSGFSVIDVDGTGNEQMTITAANGTVTLSTEAGLTFSKGSGIGNTTMTFTGSLAAMQTALNGMTYAPLAGFNGTDSVTIKVDDLQTNLPGGAKTGQTVLSILVTAVNQPPSYNLPSGTQLVEPGNTLTFTALKINDADENGVPETVTLQVTQGTLTLSGTTNLTFSPGSTNGASSMTFTGELADVNNALNGMTYTPTAGYQGPD
ncbi:MAG TPA: autotransporter-associated beta strand repeat-containing protein, partial [Pirellulales bacterium]